VFRSLAVSLLFVATMTPLVSGQQWARKMFESTSHDFGAVARHSKAVYDFEFKNIYEEDIHIAGVRSSCRCTEPQVTKHTLKTWDKSAIRAVFNTRSFLGSRSATLTVIIDKPYYAEVQLSVRGYIRGDVLFSPGGVSFGDVEMGQITERTVSVTYHGRRTWEIVDVRSANPHFEVELTDEDRSFGRVNYKMLVRLKDTAPDGYIHDQLTVVTNDSYNGSLELPVEGRVVPPLTVNPASLFLGVLKPGESVEKKLFVKGKRPFKIVGIECADDCFQFKTTERSTTAHLIPVIFTASNQPGKVSEEIEIKTDLGAGATTTCVASATVAGESDTKEPDDKDDD
jgi:hypothetical protein